MNPAQLLSHFDRISDAPDAISRLRRFILDLAVRGKLVEQDPRDEPASELLKRIQEEKARLVHAGEIKKEKPLPAIEADEIPFAIPATWQWVRLNDITSYIQRGKSPKYAAGEGLPVISQKCVQWGGLEFESAKLITRESIEEYEPIRFLRRGDLLWNSTGTGTIGRIVKVKELLPKLVCDSHVTVVRCLDVDAEYVRSWLRSDHVYAVIEHRAAGSTNQVELTAQLALNQVVPLPPLAEQQRIVAKVDELMALCDRLEAAQAERESQRDRLVASSLNRLNNGADGDAFRDHAHFYFNHLPCLTTRSEHIQQLRQTILNLAVRGKLVPQDPNDEPAAELLNRIRTEKTRQAEAGGLKQQQSLAKTETIEPPFEIPDSWCWGRMDDCFAVGGGIQKTPDRIPKDHPYPYIGVANVYRGRLDLSVLKQFELFEGDLEKFRLVNGDILVVEGNGSPNEIGRCAMWSGEISECVHQNHIIRCHPFILEFTPFVLRFLNSPNGIEIMKSLAITSSGLYSLSVGKIRTIRIPIAPLAEQHRIVAKVDELMALCDRLEAQLTTAQTESRRLLEAVLHEALAGTELPTLTTR